VKTVYFPGDRRDHYVADLELSRFASVFIEEELRPRMERAIERLRRMEELMAELPPDERAAMAERIAKLRHWLEKGQTIMPWLLKFLVI